MYKSPYFHFLQPRILAHPAPFILNFSVNSILRNESHSVDYMYIIHHSPLILNYSTCTIGWFFQRVYRRLRHLDLQTCFFSSNGREQQVGPKTAQCSHFTPGRSKTPVLATPCFTFTLSSLRSGHTAVLRFSKIPTMAACTTISMTDSNVDLQNMCEGSTRHVYLYKSSPRIDT